MPAPLPDWARVLDAGVLAEWGNDRTSCVKGRMPLPRNELR